MFQLEPVADRPVVDVVAVAVDSLVRWYLYLLLPVVDEMCAAVAVAAVSVAYGSSALCAAVAVAAASVASGSSAHSISSLSLSSTYTLCGLGSYYPSQLLS